MGETKITHHCKMPFFFIEKNRDEMYYDVINMDACNLIFGRLWQYDAYARHLGYVFSKDNVSYTLIPIK
jgi:hypothetical protein